MTLLVTPEQAETLTLAGNEGRIQLVLRNSSDQAMEKTPGSDVNALVLRARTRVAKAGRTRCCEAKSCRSPAKAGGDCSGSAAPPPAPAPPPEIVVIRGNQRTVEVVPQKAN